LDASPSPACISIPHKCRYELANYAAAAERYSNSGVAQLNLFDDNAPRPGSEKLMSVLDSLNARVGRGTLYFAGQGIEQQWQMKRDMLSPRYTRHTSSCMCVGCVRSPQSHSYLYSWGALRAWCGVPANDKPGQKRNGDNKHQNRECDANSHTFSLPLWIFSLHRIRFPWESEKPGNVCCDCNHLRH